MKTVKANNYSKAAKEMAAIDESAVALVPEDINENDRYHNVVILVMKVDNKTLKKYETKLNIQQYDNKGLVNIEKRFQAQGYDKIILLHRAEAQNSAAPAQAAAAPAKTEEQIRAEIRAEIEAENAASAASTQTPAATPAPALDAANAPLQTQEETGEKPQMVDGKLYEDITVRELNDYAATNQIDLTGLSKKEDIFNAIVFAVAEKNK